MADKVDVISEAAQMDSPREYRRQGRSKKEASFTQWKDEIEKAEKGAKEYQKRIRKINERFRAEQEAPRRGGDRRYNVLWSITNTMLPNLFMGMPKPYVSRRFRDSDPVARAASRTLERMLTYVNDSDEINDAFEDAVRDYVLDARGVVWTRYNPIFDLKFSQTKKYYESESELPDIAEIGEEKVQGPEGEETRKWYKGQYEDLSDETCETDHVTNYNFLHPPHSQWKELPWISRIVLMNREELVERFGDKGKDVPLKYKSNGERIASKEIVSDEEGGLFRVARIYEVWDKVARKVRWICIDCDDFLDVKDDPLGLKNFFPCPKPLFGTLSANSLIPVPDFKYYEDVAVELDEITFRISLLTESLRVAGIYDASMGDIVKRLATETSENDLIPVENYQVLAESGGLSAAIQFLPLNEIIVVLEKLYEARRQLIQELYEITGMSDIIRGSSDPRETAAAQKIKGQYASKRLVKRQRAVARFAREHLEIQAEIMCKHYSPETIARIAGVDQFILTPDGQFDAAMFEQVIELLKNNPLRMFRIKIDNDTLAGDELQTNKEEVTQFLTGVTQLMTGVFPIAQQAPPLAKAMKELIMFGVRAHPVGRSVESAIEQALDEVAQNVPPPEQKAEKSGPSPEELDIRKHEAETKRQSVGVQRQALLLDERKQKHAERMDMLRLGSEEKLRVRDQDNKAGIEESKLSRKDRELDIKETQVVGQISNQAEQAAVKAASDAANREQADRHAAEQREHDTEVKAIEVAERRVERDDARDERAESRQQAVEDRDEENNQRDLDRKAASRKGGAE